eukprot:1187372-Pyramimonas_sp.AAC.2
MNNYNVLATRTVTGLPRGHAPDLTLTANRRPEPPGQPGRAVKRRSNKAVNKASEAGLGTPLLGQLRPAANINGKRQGSSTSIQYTESTK